MKYQISVELDLGIIEADSLADAEAEAYAILSDYASSNDGSELLANATPEVEEIE